MNKVTVLVLGVLATASAVSAQTPAPATAGTTFYVEPSVVLALPGEFDNAVGGALALGVTIKGVHAVEAQVISFKTQEGDDFTFTPVLATYKYRAALSGRFSLIAGGSIGATLEKVERYTPHGPGGYPTYPGGAGFWDSESQTAFTAGLVGGVSYAFNDRVSLDASAHVLWLQETDVVSAGSIALVTLGVNVRF